MYEATARPPENLRDSCPRDLTAALKEAARSLGADLVGVADPARLAEEPPRHSPQAIFPEAKSIIVLGRRITRGTLRGVEEGTNWNTYEFFGRQWIEDQYLSRTSFEVVCFLEDIGYEAVPVFAYPPETPAMGIPTAEGRPAPNVIPDARIAAAVAGLGEIGRLGELITPEFGTLQRLCIILTDALLDFDEPRTFDFCRGCNACVEACPLGAASADRESEVQRAGLKWKELQLNEGLCHICKNGAYQSRFVGSSKIDRTAAACMRACLVSLERRGLLARKFHNPFRVRSAWSVNACGEVDSGGRL